MIRKTMIATLLGAGLMLTGIARAADDYPNRPITIVVPVAPGGTVDRIARIVAEGLSKQFGQPVIVESRAGASGTIGTRSVAASKPDGYTLLAIANTFASAPEFVANAGYEPLKDFTPITQTCSIPMVLVTNPTVKQKTIKEMIEFARSSTEAISLGSSGLGSTGYIAAELFSRAAGIKILNVYYKGNSQALSDVMGGHLYGMFDQVSTAVSNVKSGKIHALAVTTRTRSPSLPDIPTLDEAGLKGFHDETFNAIMAPAGTPPAIVAKLYESIKQVMTSPEIKKKLSEQGIDATVSESPEAFGQYLAASIKNYKEIAAMAPKK